MPDQTDIIYTKVDEAPELASASFLPILQAFTKPAGITVGVKDISLAGRIIAAFPERLEDAQRQPCGLSELDKLVKTPEANIVKLPNISASLPQLAAAITELQEQGYDIPDYPEDPKTDVEREIQSRYGKIKGSAVNPVLREGNSDRRSLLAVKNYAKKNPHSMGKWASNSKTSVATMDGGDFHHNEKSVTLSAAATAKIEFVDSRGDTTVMKDGLALQAGEVLDATFMSIKALRVFLAEQIAKAKEEQTLFSLHMKATMMKVSDPIIFGHGVRVFFASVFEKHADVLAELGVNPDNGMGELEKKIVSLPTDQRDQIKASIKACMDAQPDLYMVDSDKGVTNLHVPSDVIIDASMPAVIRAGGIGWGPNGKPQDVRCVIPDSSYADVYDVTVKSCIKDGAFDPATMGSVSNVGLMAQKAEEYGSHDKTFKAPGDGVMRVVDDSGATLLEHIVEKGDIWRACQVKDAPIRDWVGLAVKRARATGVPAVFWLSNKRAHHIELIKKVTAYLKDHDTDGLTIKIMSPQEATEYSLKRVRNGEDAISVTGNVLRDYNTDLFPILELGTSAKMLSIVPLMQGGGLFETGAGGSAPKHVRQFVQEGHLRWDSLGEFAALTASFEHLAGVKNNPKAALMGKTLNTAIGRVLDENKSPSRKVNELDNKGSHFYLAMYWARALADQDGDAGLKAHFGPIAEQMESNEAKILSELDATQGGPADLGGYYHADPAKVAANMRPSVTLNLIING